MVRLVQPTRWVPVIATMICFIVTANPVMIATSGMFAVPVTAEFGWTRSQFFAGLTVLNLVSAFILPFVGQLVDMRGVKAAIIPGIVVFALCVAGLSQQNGSWVFYLALMGALGVASMLHGPVPYTRATLAAAGARRGLALAVSITGVTIGLILIPQLAARLISSMGWRGAELTLAGLVLAVALPCALLFIDRAGATKAVSGLAASGRSEAFPWKDLKGRTFWILGIAFLLNAVVIHAFLAHAAAIALDEGLSVEVGALAVSVYGIGSVVARLASGILLDRVRSPQISQLWYGVAVLGFLVLSSGTGEVALIAAAALVGAAAGAEGEVIAYFASRFWRPELYGRIYGLLLLFFMAGASLGPLLVAIVYDVLGNYTWAMLGLALVQGIGCLAMLTVGPYRYRAALHNGGGEEAQLPEATAE